jgi:hypothetical protein
MKTYDLQGIDLEVPRDRAFDFIADPAQLPRWTHAFAAVTPGRAFLRTANGEVSIELGVEASRVHGTVDWRMTFPDGSQAIACSRVVSLGSDRCVYSFVLPPPPVPLEQVEGALEVQSRTLAVELANLKQILERHGRATAA